MQSGGRYVRMDCKCLSVVITVKRIVFHVSICVVIGCLNTVSHVESVSSRTQAWGYEEIAREIESHFITLLTSLAFNDKLHRGKGITLDSRQAAIYILFKDMLDMVEKG